MDIISPKIRLVPWGLFWPLWKFLRLFSREIGNWFGLLNFSEEFREAEYYHILTDPKSEISLDLSISEQEAVLSIFGLKRKSYFCIAIRDGSFHRYRLPDQAFEEYRNQVFENFGLAIKDISAVKFVRIGRTSDDEFVSSNLYDYTRCTQQSDTADLVLLANSLGLISGGDGVANVAHVLKVPVLLIRYGPWEVFPTFSKDNWIVPALLRSKLSGDLISLQETFRLDIAKGYNWPFPTSGDFYVHNYSVAEIRDFISEFTSFYSDREVQQESHTVSQLCCDFWRLFRLYLPARFHDKLLMHSKIHARIPESFLRSYATPLGLLH